jgi:hypothetical protein
MEKIVHEVRHDTETFRSGGVVTERSQFASMEVAECNALLCVEIGAVGVQPVDRLFSNTIAVFMIHEGECTMGN